MRIPEARIAEILSLAKRNINAPPDGEDLAEAVMDLLAERQMLLDWTRIEDCPDEWKRERWLDGWDNDYRSRSLISWTGYSWHVQRSDHKTFTPTHVRLLPEPPHD